MTVRVRRTFEFDAPPTLVWDFISDPGKRAEAISVVESYDVRPESNEATWHVRLPIPFLDSTAAVETQDVELDPPRYVKFVGKSKVMRVTGEHTVSEANGTTRLENEFVVDGRVPGVERYFKRNLDRELENLERALRTELNSE
jgi:carbon monoxide dehydrogenase subunit G